MKKTAMINLLVSHTNDSVNRQEIVQFDNIKIDKVVNNNDEDCINFYYWHTKDEEYHHADEYDEDSFLWYDNKPFMVLPGEGLVIDGTEYLIKEDMTRNDYYELIWPAIHNAILEDKLSEL